jgi:hypothetical protein
MTRMSPFNLSHSIPFSHAVEIQGAYQGMECWADVAVSEFYADPGKNINNELRIIDTELVLGLDAQVFEAQEGEIIVDAYSPNLFHDSEKKKNQAEAVCRRKSGSNHGKGKHFFSLRA